MKKEQVSNKKVIIGIILLATIFTLLNCFGVTEKLVTAIKENTQKALSAVFNSQEELEINRDDTPEINVQFIGDENAKITLNYDGTISEMQYRTDEKSEDWQTYTGEFIVKENTVIQTRYKKQGEEEYTIGSSKVIADIDYNITLETPEVTITTKTVNDIEKAQVSVNSNDEQDKTIVYEISVTKYSLNEDNLLNSDGTINETAVSNKESSSYSRLEESTEGIYTKIDSKNIEITKSGIYKIKVRATTNGGYVKSEETEKYVKIDNVVRTDLLTFTMADSNTNYQFEKTGTNEYTGSCSEEDIIVKLNINEDITSGNNTITYNGIALSKDVQNPIETISTAGSNTRVITFKIGAVNVTYTYIIKIGHTAGADATCTTVQYCANCGIVMSSALGHDFTETVVSDTYLKSSATCTSPAVYYYKCSRCTTKGTSTYTSGSALGHSTPSTYSTDGTYHWKLCANGCGTYVVKQTAHSGGTAYCKTLASCSTCGTSYGDYDTDNHKSFTTLSSGSYVYYNASYHSTRKCSACSKTYYHFSHSTSSYSNSGSSGHYKYCAGCKHTWGSIISHSIGHTATKSAASSSLFSATAACSVCDYSTNHKITSYSSTTGKGTCSTCGKKVSVSLTAD